MAGAPHRKKVVVWLIPGQPVRHEGSDIGRLGEAVAVIADRVEDVRGGFSGDG